VLTGYVSGAGTVAATDSILQAFQKINGNDALKAPLASPTFTGVISNDLGAIGAPSYTFTGDPNTGMWSSGADTLDFSTAGARGLQIGSVGQLIMGIGTTATTTGHTAQSATATNTSNFRILNRNGSAARAGLLFSPASGTDGADFLIDTTGGYHWKNASNTEIGDVSNAGAWTLGPSSGLTAQHIIRSASGSGQLDLQGTAAASRLGLTITNSASSIKGYIVVAGSSNDLITGDVLNDLNISFTGSNLNFGATTALVGKVTSAGAWTWGPSAGGAEHVANGIITAECFVTASGSQSAVHNTATTFYTIASQGHYIVSVWLNGVATTYGCFANVINSNGSGRIVSNDGGNATITLSGSTLLQVTQLSGSTQTMTWNVTKVGRL